MSSNWTEGIRGNCVTVISRDDNGRVCRFVPSAEQLIRVSDAAINLVDAAEKTFCISGQDDPFRFPSYVRPRYMPFAILRLERALNPRRLAFDDPRRHRILRHGWAWEVSDGLSWLRKLHDEVLVAWQVEALCGPKCVFLLISRLVAPDQIDDRTGQTTKMAWWGDLYGLLYSKSHDGMVEIEMPKDWPPKIDRAILESMTIAASWIKEGVECHFPSAGSAAEGATLPPLSEKAAIAWEILLELPPHRGLTGTKLLEALAARGVASDQSTMSKWIIPPLKARGVEIKPRFGYFIPTHKRPAE